MPAAGAPAAENHPSKIGRARFGSPRLFRTAAVQQRPARRARRLSVHGEGGSAAHSPRRAPSARRRLQALPEIFPDSMRRRPLPIAPPLCLILFAPAPIGRAIFGPSRLSASYPQALPRL